MSQKQTHQGLQLRTVNGELDERAISYLERELCQWGFYTIM